MKGYTGKFYDINENEYTVNINKHVSSTPIELTFTDTPVVIDMHGTDDLFKPIKYTSCTINLVNTNLYADLFSGSYENIVEITDKDNKTIFLGYVSPNVYSQNYAYTYEELSIECVDCLSVLQEKKYTLIGDTKNIYSFEKIIKHILNGLVESLYIQLGELFTPNDNLGIQWFQDETKLSYYNINEQNFFDEDDEPMYCSEVLESLLHYYGMSIVQYGDSYYIYDFDTINASRSIIDFMWIDLTTDDEFTIDTFNHAVNLSDAISSDDSNISIGQVFNKISINSDLYPITSIIPDINEDLELYTDEESRTLDNGLVQPFEFVGRMFLNNGEYGGPASIYYSPDFIAANPGYKSTPLSDDYVWYFNKIFKSKTIKYVEPNELGDKPYLYNDSFMTSWYPETTSNYTYNYPSNMAAVGNYYGPYLESTFVKSAFKENEKSTADVIYPEDLKTIQYNFLPKFNNGVSLAVRRIPVQNETISPPPTMEFLDDYVFLKIKSKTNMVFNNQLSFCLDFKVDFYGAFKASINNKKKKITKEEYLKYTEYSTTNSAGYTFLDGLKYQPKILKDIYAASTPILEAYVCHNGKYYVGNGNWVNEPTVYTIPLEISGDSFVPKRNYTFLDNVSNECHLIYTNDTSVDIGDFFIAFKYPKWISITQYLSNEYPRTYTPIQYMVLRDIDIKLENVNAINMNNTEDTVYESVINPNNITEFEDITLKICTWDNKEPNYSSVLLGSDGVYEFLDTVKYKGEDLRMEEVLMRKYISQYSTPTFIYNASVNIPVAPYSNVYIRYFDHNYHIESFVVNGYTWDVKNCQNNITLRQYNTTQTPQNKKQSIQRQYYRTGLIYKANPS